MKNKTRKGLRTEVMKDLYGKGLSVKEIIKNMRLERMKARKS